MIVSLSVDTIVALSKFKSAFNLSTPILISLTLQNLPYLKLSMLNESKAISGDIPIKIAKLAKHVCPYI